MSERNSGDAIGWLILIVSALVALMLVLGAHFARAHDHNHPERNAWLKSLHAKNTTWCCDGNDTDVVEDWETTAGGYRVKFRGTWFDVPEGANRRWPQYQRRGAAVDEQGLWRAFGEVLHAGVDVMREANTPQRLCSKRRHRARAVPQILDRAAALGPSVQHG